MDGMREGNSISRPPLLDGTNYPYWKAKMTAFLRSVNTKTWKSVLTGWTAPTVTDNGVTTVKKQSDWNIVEEELSLGNSKALNAIFCAVDPNIFKMISSCIVAKEAWEVLQTAYEGTQKVRMSRLEQLTTRWETLKMEEDETISSYNSKINYIANESFALGQTMSNEKLVRKILRPLPKRFAHKVTAIEEAQDLTTMKVDELVGNLTTFEMTFDEGDAGKKKRLALKVSTKEGDEDNLVETMNMLAKRFNKKMRKFNKKSYGGNEGATGGDRGNNSWKNQNKNGGNYGQTSKAKGIQCTECEGYGHIQVECPNYVKKQSRSYYTTLTDEDTDEEEPSEDKVNNFVAFMEKISDDNQLDNPTVDNTLTPNDSDEEDLTQEELTENYKVLFCKWSKLTSVFTVNEAD
ncbi:hypothetical protein LIER_34927 [Lithospermum erythrorhizon]|uniref:Gag-pol polyprotein n=1 Tax=Lithospermum erythrorhizon TaxID=34254 RepID=A0AAV3NJX1_LITER